MGTTLTAMSLKGQAWKTAKVMTIKGKKCYLIGKDLWIPDEYVTITK
ncbi:hypothetical protein [Lactobacillus delbrueckii]|nr:hypothetical protein [Lactobacillus delbrueckii]